MWKVLTSDCPPEDPAGGSEVIWSTGRVGVAEESQVLHCSNTDATYRFMPVLQLDQLEHSNHSVSLYNKTIAMDLKSQWQNTYLIKHGPTCHNGYYSEALYLHLLR